MRGVQETEPAPGLSANAVAELLDELGQRVELSGEGPYKARAYYRAAEQLRVLAEPLDRIVAEDRLREIPGVGAAIEEKIAVLHRTGTHRTLERLRAEVPASVLEMLNIPRLPAPKVALIYRDLGIASVDELETACTSGRLAGVKGIGPALQARILAGIGLMRRAGSLRHIHHAGALLETAAGNLAASHPHLSRITPAGEYRRGCELVGELRLVAENATGAPGNEGFPDNEAVALTLASPATYGVALLLATGSEDHVRALCAQAAGRGLELTPDGLMRGADLLPTPEEHQVYATLGLPFIPPALRETGAEIALAAAGALPRLVEAADLRGVLHCHTTASDGVNTLAEMAEATRARGYGYFGVADHSQSAGYAGGLSVAEIEAQHEEIDALNAGYDVPFRILKGIESDIRLDGSLDYPDDVLARFDFVVASIHSRFALDEVTQTERILRAVASPFTTVLGHMTGRLLLRREPYAIDIERVLAACAEHGVAVEINANPHRLDLDWRWHARALELGCIFSINPDAHSTDEIDLTRWGLLMAQKGGIPKERVLNAMDLDAISGFLAARRTLARH